MQQSQGNPTSEKTPGNSRPKRNRFKQNPYKGIFLKDNPEYLKKFLELQKQAIIWQSQGQYWLAAECERRMSCLENENIAEFLVIHHSEKLFHKTKKFQWSV